MQAFNLPHAGIGGKGHHLRRIAAAAISQLEICAAGYAASVHPDSPMLGAFFTACADGSFADGLTTPTAAVSPQTKTFSVAAGATAGATLTKDSAGAATYSSSATGVATVNAATGAVTGVSPGTAFIIVSIAATATFRAWSFRYPITVTA